MATAQLIRQKTNTSNEVEQFLKQFPNAQESVVASQKFCMQLVATVISNITYLHKVFPEDAYVDRTIGDVPVKLLHSKKTTPDAYQLIKWIKGAHDALVKKYLKQMVFGLSKSKNKPGEVYESFTFNFSYKANGEVCVDGPSGVPSGDPSCSLESIIKSTIDLLSKSYVCASAANKESADKISVSMKLYYGEGTPEDYEPPNFQPSPCKAFTFPAKPMAVHLGAVGTPWHNLGMQMRTSEQDSLHVRGATPAMSLSSRKQQPQGVDSEAMDCDFEGVKGDTCMASQELPEECESLNLSQETPEKGGCPPAMPASQSVPRQFFTPSLLFPSPGVLGFVTEPPPYSPGQPDSGVSTTGSRATQPYVGRIMCPCGTEEQLSGVMLQCSSCGFWQHAICFGVLCDKLVRIHTCNKCAVRTGDTCTDLHLVKLKAAESQQDLCVYRHVLALCLEVFRMNENVLEENLDLEKSKAKLLMERLEKDGVLDTNRSRIGVKINRAKLMSNIIPKYFDYYEKPPQEENVDNATKALRELTTSPGTGMQGNEQLRPGEASKGYIEACHAVHQNLKLCVLKKGTKRPKAGEEENDDDEVPPGKKVKVSKPARRKRKKNW